MSKIFERIIHIQLQDYFNSNNLLAEQQYGFRPNHSTEYAAVKLVDHINNTMDGHKIPGTIFIDLSKAFHTLSLSFLFIQHLLSALFTNKYALMRYLINTLQNKAINNLNNNQF